MAYGECPTPDPECRYYWRPSVEGGNQDNGCYSDKHSLYRSSNSSFDVPATTNSVEHRSWCYAVSPAVRRYIVNYTVDFYKNNFCRVVNLSFLSSPPAILRAVVTIVIYSIKGVFRSRLTPHVRKEVGEVVPSFTDFNTPPAVPVVMVILLVAASMVHSLPASILAGFIFVSTVFVFGVVAASKRSASIASPTAVALKQLPSTVVARKSETAITPYTQTATTIFRVLAPGVYYNQGADAGHYRNYNTGVNYGV